MKRILTLVLVMTFVLSSMVIIGGVSLAADEKIELVIYPRELQDTPWWDDVMSDWEKENPNITLKIIETPDYDTKIVVSVAAGEEIDIAVAQNPIQLKNYVTAQTIFPLDSMAEEAGFSFTEAYGENFVNQKINGSYYFVPNKRSVWFLVYNKSIFDKYGIPYPDSRMTWKEYRELAQKLTRGEGVNKTYGAYNLKWPIFFYNKAIQELGGGEHFYNEEGLSNISDQAFRESLKFHYEMMHEDKSVPTYVEFITENLGNDGFFSGKYAMHTLGPWVLNMIKNKERRPRDWKVGISTIPVPEGKEGPISWGVYNGFVIPKTSEHKETAFKFITFVAEKMAQYSTTNIPAYTGINDSNYASELAKVLEDEGITEDDINRAILNPDMQIITEKITGPAAAEYDAIFQEEIEMYFVQAQSLDDTIKRIEERANKAIEKAMEDTE